jgi:hypothetical protein
MAARWQGYVARLGLGMTLIKNHSRAADPVMGSSTAGQRLCRSAPSVLPVTGQVLTPSRFILPSFQIVELARKE